MIRSQAMSPVAVGLIWGMGLLWYAGQSMRGALYGIGAIDVMMVATLGSAMLAAGMSACLVPLLRTARIEPATLLKRSSVG